MVLVVFEPAKSGITAVSKYHRGVFFFDHRNQKNAFPRVVLCLYPSVLFVTTGCVSIDRGTFGPRGVHGLSVIKFYPLAVIFW